MIVRRERAHPGAQLSFTDHDGHRFQAVLTDQPDPDIQILERRQRQRAHAETHIRNDKDTGLRNLPFRDFEHNRVWLMLVGIAHDLLVWTQRLLLTGELARCEPKRLRYRLLHVAARLAFHARKATLRIHSRVALGRRPRRRVRTRPSASRPRLTPAPGAHDDEQALSAPARGVAAHAPRPYRPSRQREHVRASPPP